MAVTVKGAAMTVAACAAAFVAYRTYSNFKAASKSVGNTVDAVKAAGVQLLTKDLNPASPENVVYRGVSAVGEKITGQSGWSLGSQIYDWVNPDFTLTSSERVPQNIVTQVTNSTAIVPDSAEMTQAEKAKSDFRQFEIAQGKMNESVYDSFFRRITAIDQSQPIMDFSLF